MREVCVVLSRLAEPLFSVPYPVQVSSIGICLEYYSQKRGQGRARDLGVPRVVTVTLQSECPCQSRPPGNASITIVEYDSRPHPYDARMRESA